MKGWSSASSGRRLIRFLAAVTTLVIALPITTVDRGWPNHIPVEGPSGLTLPSWIMTEQPRTLSRDRLTGTSGRASREAASTRFTAGSASSSTPERQWFRAVAVMGSATSTVLSWTPHRVPFFRPGRDGTAGMPVQPVFAEMSSSVCRGCETRHETVFPGRPSQRTGGTVKKSVIASATVGGAAALLAVTAAPAWAGYRAWETDLACTAGSAYTRGSGNGDVQHFHRREGTTRERIFRNGAAVKSNTFYGGLPIVTFQSINNAEILRSTSRNCAD